MNTTTTLPPVVCGALVRPDSPGFFWCLRQGGRSGAQWHIVKAAMIYWGDEDDGERVLACTAGGCWQRCDMMNRDGYDDGTRYFRATPPDWPNAEMSHHQKPEEKP